MSANLENYLEEISHYLAVGPGREEILSEIRSHILEKAEDEHGQANDVMVEKVIADFGPARKVAERYLEGQEIIAPAYRRHLFRYTLLLFAVHFLFTVAALVFHESFLFFPLLFVPKMGIIEALMYLPTAFLTDLGLVALLLYFITRSKKNIKLPWPKFSVDLDEIVAQGKPVLRSGIVGRIIKTLVMLALTVAAAVIFSRYGTIFLFSRHGADFQPIFTPETGRYLTLILILAWGFGTLSAFARIFIRSPWIKIISDVVSLAVVGLFLRVPLQEGLVWPADEHMQTFVTNDLFALFLFIALMVTIDLVKNLVILGKRKLATEHAEKWQR